MASPRGHLLLLLLLAPQAAVFASKTSIRSQRDRRDLKGSRPEDGKADRATYHVQIKLNSK